MAAPRFFSERHSASVGPHEFYSSKDNKYTAQQELYCKEQLVEEQASKFKDVLKIWARVGIRTGSEESKSDHLA